MNKGELIEAVKIPARNAPSFKAGAALKAAVN